jgi:hypothetical protein
MRVKLLAATRSLSLKALLAMPQSAAQEYVASVRPNHGPDAPLHMIIKTDDGITIHYHEGQTQHPWMLKTDRTSDRHWQEGVRFETWDHVMAILHKWDSGEPVALFEKERT